MKFDMRMHHMAKFLIEMAFLDASLSPILPSHTACAYTYRDLPEGLVDFLISFILDALGLHRDQLLRTPDEHKRNPNKWWLDLAENDDARERLFHVLSEKRVIWSGKTRIAIGRALEDLRRYHFDPDRAMLLPSKKKRVMVEGSTVTKEDEVIQKTETVEDEVEVVED
ncbi:unnamed protein product [Cylicocyclus nassatus]|uniref:Uncharacterized protein n=1 Tax=Cylicocyclus nassatus TaxID=53992 RepID=A0AA36GXU7_CYLNA|nr:unnamed protein product [Cylicocyclus nassatus]